MPKIIRNEMLEKFIEDNEVMCQSIVLDINHQNKTASIVIDGDKKIKVNYDFALEYE